MRRFLSIAIVAFAAGGFLFARENMQAPKSPDPEKKLINFKSDNSGPIAPGDSVIFLVGNFAAQHNGAVITCDSAVRYSDRHFEFYGNVLINKNTTYIYGDRATYNGNINEAEVFSDLVKVVDEDATLYTYRFIFNTKENIGRFEQGGVMINRDNLLEAIRGYYYADAKELICVDEVEMRNDEYELRGDSVVYNMATDHAAFFDRTNIWSKDGDYLYADRGTYSKADSLYKVTRNGYILTEKQEVWSDSIDFYRAKDHVIMWHDIQIDDTEHKVLAFGDYGEYWKEPGDAILTRRPVVISYDTSQGDSLFMRADSMFLFTIRKGQQTAAAETTSDAAQETTSSDSAAVTATEGSESTADSGAERIDSIGGKAMLSDSLANGGNHADSLAGARTDSLARPAADTVQLTKEQRKELALKAKAAQKAQAAKVKKAKLAEVAAKRREKATAKLLAQKEREEIRLAALKVRTEAKLRARQARAARKGKTIPADSTALREIDSLMNHNTAQQDSLVGILGDSLVRVDSAAIVAVDSLQNPLAEPGDSLYRLIKGYRNVKVYRTDFQTVCDSLVAISTDSTIHLYIEPVLWNENSQVTSDVMDIFTKNQQLVRAEFVGSPMMVSQLDTLHYNQVAGKTMTAYFRNNAIFRNDVNGNVQTIFYFEDGEPAEVVGMTYVESGDCSYYIEDKQVVTIVYRVQPTYTLSPMDKIPSTQEFFLKGFKWQGERRPTQAEIFDRRIRPSEREQRRKLLHPDFPIQMRINNYKGRLLELRRWSDRNDKVDAETVEWMRQLGYEVGMPRKSGAKP